MTLAHEVPGGALVRHLGKIWLKASRDSKDYVNHYLVAANSQADLALVYIDPETDIEVLAPSASLLNLTSRIGGEDSRPGDLLDLESGRQVIKVLDVKKDGQRHLAYVDVASGDIRPRLERGAAMIYAAWTLA